jgi:signal transduction histidine kinase
MSAGRLTEIQSGSSGVGIRGMRERLRQFRGEMHIDSDENGTRILVTIPISPAELPANSPAAESLPAAV